MKTKQLSVKNIQIDLFKELKTESVRDGMKIGDSLNLAIKYWLDEKRKSRKLSLLDFKPKRLSKGKGKTSEEIDKILYE
ncbi:MAG TPA: hypothetical protein VJJ23_03665 [Candidatus Nanoarchaeia archaeon]|nr:hypothetical protein [Candidatus Nanoarchaeia archaeon]